MTPSFNQGRFIRETIESVLSQDYQPIEYIVLDGGSTDDTLQILKEYEGRLTYWSEKDNGQSDAINKGFRRARGEIVAWLNSDDVYEPGCIRKAVQAFQEDPALSLVYGGGYIIDDKSKKLKVFEYTQEFDYWKLINFWDYIMQPATFFRADKLKKIGYLDENLHYCMDWDLWIRLASVGKVKFIKELWACSREYGDTKTSTGGDRRLEEITGLLKKYSRHKDPIGIRSYSASTLYAKHVSNKISHYFFGVYLHLLHKRLMRCLPERYADSWIGKEYAVIIPDYADHMTFDLSVPDNRLLPQVMEIKVNGKSYKRFKITDNAAIIITVENVEKQYTEVSFRCDKCIRLSMADRRKLGAQIGSVNAL